LRSLGQTLARQGKKDEAEKLFRQAKGSDVKRP
jgi:hypothetical protein